MLTFDSIAALSATIRHQARGPWLAWLKLDGDAAPATHAALADEGGYGLTGTVLRGGINAALLQWEGLVVGGAGGLARPVEGAYRSAQVGDILAAIAAQSGESMSSSSTAALKAVSLPFWTLGRCSAAQALDALSGAATEALGAPVTWRTLADGTIWMGSETWPTATLPESAEVVEQFPADPRYVIASAFCQLLPGVDIEGVGRVLAVDTYAEPASVREHAWL